LKERAPSWRRRAQTVERSAAAVIDGPDLDKPV
jgi:hypothetical protein